MIRPDISNTLIHLTRDKDGLKSEEVFQKIVKEKKLIGNNEFIRGRHNCICFSETPISAIGQIIAQDDTKFHYGPFGFLFSKKYLFEKGARPVIYQPDADYELLPDVLRYRHVRFEVDYIDWTWEREWRLKIDQLDLDSSNVTLIVPDRKIIEGFKSRQESRNRVLGLVSEGLSGHAKVEWHFISLEDLGFK
jgi:hypothetical protein